MQGLKKLFRFYLFSNIHVALAGASLTLLTILKFNIGNFYYAGFVFFAIVISYTFIRFFEVKLGKIKWYKMWWQENRNVLLFIQIIGSIVLLLIFVLKKIDSTALLVLVPFFLITLFYVIPVYKTKFLEISFRNFPFIKIYSIALAWAGVTVLFPLHKLFFTAPVWINFFQVFVFVIAITLPFDIRDVKTDEKKLKTIPQLAGIKKTKYIAIALTILFVILEFFKTHFSLEVPFVGLLILIFVIVSSPAKKRIFTSFWVEAIPIFWLLAYLIKNVWTIN